MSFSVASSSRAPIGECGSHVLKFALVMQRRYLGLVEARSPKKALSCRWKSTGTKQLAWLCAQLLAAMLLFLNTAFAQQSSADFDSLVQSAAVAREQNDLPRAIELYRNAVAINASWPDGWWYLGLLQYATDTYAPARDAFSHFIELTPNAGPATALRGLCEFELGDYETALQDVQHGIALGAANDPHNRRILRYHDALLLARTGDFEGAIDSYARFARDESSDPELFVAIGLAGLRQPLLPRDIPSDQVRLYRDTGQAAYSFMAGDEQSADQAFQELFTRYPKTANIHYLYAYLLLAVDPASASAQLSLELKVDPSNNAALVLAAWVDMLQSKFQDALVYARKAVSLQPDLPMAELELGRSLVESGDIKQGLDYLDKVEQLQPDNIEVHLAFVAAYSKANQPEEARRERLICLKLSQQGGSGALQ
jgi:cytochrome c-type biogenesis protein CcmH/NrfG